MSSASLAHRQIAKAKHEAEASLASVKSLKEQWVAATNQNPTNITQKDIDQLTKAFKNRLLTLKWDCEDLEELINGDFNHKITNIGASGNRNVSSNELLNETGDFLRECRQEMTKFMNQLEGYEQDRRIFNKHGLASSTLPDNMVASIIQNPFHAAQYDRLPSESQNMMMEDVGGEIPHFDKSQIQSSTTIFNNALYEHFEDEDALTKSVNATRVFNNLTRPNSDDICVGTNENEMILEMLETEYYNPPAGLLAKTNYSTAIKNLFDADRNKFLGTIAFLFSFPIILILFLVI